MYTDIAVPNHNEAEFIEIASKLSIKKLCFLYDFEEYYKNKIQEKLESLENKKVNVEFGLLVNQKNINMALQQSKLLAAKSSDNNRHFIESKKIKLIYGFEDVNRKDYLHQRASGLNHVLCELAKKNNVVIGFAYSSLFNKNTEMASLIMGRMMQNIALCRKYKVKTAIGSFSRNPFEMRAQHDIASLFAMLGMDGKNIKESVSLDL